MPIPSLADADIAQAARALIDAGTHAVSEQVGDPDIASAVFRARRLLLLEVAAQQQSRPTR